MKKIFASLFIFLISTSFVYSADKPTDPIRDFPYLLNATQNTPCKKVAELCEKLDFSDVLKNIQEIEKNLFPYRSEVTNGYQCGFFLFALKGYALENLGRIPEAYRNYQTSLLYINEDKALYAPVMQLEVYAVIGRVCLKLSRFEDAQNYFDTVYFEGQMYTNLTSKSTFGLLAIAGRSGKTKKTLKLLEEISIAETLIPEVNILYANLLFVSGNDCKAFDVLLNNILVHGLDEDKKLKEPFIDMFLNNIMRAEDSEIERFYYLLGEQIGKSRARKGDEEFIAFLCNTRFLLQKIYFFLPKDDNLKIARQRIAEVKSNLVANAKTQKKYPKKTKNKSFKKLRKNMAQINIKGFVEKVPVIIIEDKLCEADWLQTQKKYKKALNIYKQTFLLLTNSALENISYDGTTFKNAAIAGQIMGKVKIKDLDGLNIFKEKYRFQPDGSIRVAEAYLFLSTALQNFDETPEIEFALEIFPNINPAAIFYSLVKGMNLLELRKFDEYIELCEIQKLKMRVFSPAFMYENLIAVYAAKGETEKAFNIALDGLQKIIDKADRRYYQKEILKIWSWASDDDLEKFPKIYITASIAPYLHEEFPFDFGEILNWESKNGAAEKMLRTEMKNKNYYQAIAILTNEFAGSEQPGHEFKKAIAYAAIGKTNYAFEAIMTAQKLREKIAEPIGEPVAKYPTLESPLIEKFIDSKNKTNINYYKKWLQEREKACEKEGKTEDAERIRKTLNRFKM